MQTLVYENYNKFITATDTIRQVSTCTFAKRLRCIFLVSVLLLDEARLRRDGAGDGETS